MNHRRKDSLLELISEIDTLLEESRDDINDGLHTYDKQDFTRIGRGTGKAIVARGKLEALKNLLNDYEWR